MATVSCKIRRSAHLQSERFTSSGQRVPLLARSRIKRMAVMGPVWCPCPTPGVAAKNMHRPYEAATIIDKFAASERSHVSVDTTNM
jgi:hypothetical protein